MIYVHYASFWGNHILMFSRLFLLDNLTFFFYFWSERVYLLNKIRLVTTMTVTLRTLQKEPILQFISKRISNSVIVFETSIWNLEYSHNPTFFLFLNLLILKNILWICCGTGAFIDRDYSFPASIEYSFLVTATKYSNLYWKLQKRFD